LELGTNTEVVLSDREPHEVSKLNSVWKRLRTFTFSALKAQKNWLLNVEVAGMLDFAKFNRC
jgi:hypothetical protein